MCNVCSYVICVICMWLHVCMCDCMCDVCVCVCVVCMCDIYVCVYMCMWLCVCVHAWTLIPQPAISSGNNLSGLPGLWLRWEERQPYSWTVSCGLEICRAQTGWRGESCAKGEGEASPKTHPTPCVFLLSSITSKYVEGPRNGQQLGLPGDIDVANTGAAEPHHA